MAITAASRLGISAFDDTKIVELRPNWNKEDAKVALAAVYKIQHLDRYQNQGFEADIDSYLDSNEYVQSFGDNIVPYYRGFSTQRGQKTVGFTRIQLYQGYVKVRSRSR
ncbi:phycobilisome linker polypeptide [Chondrocystis sp. NIES-4102]|nr:phycobilisome linker polypeptide [Chondrocystis sp. NIES-4102]